jgi:hypothetical protein
MHYQLLQTSFGVIPVPVPNSVIDGNGFYISYNAHDISIYGSDTTALVLGQMQRFYILAGDHRGQYAALIDRGFDACLDYFKAHATQAHGHSDKLPA